MPDRIKEEFARSAGARELIENLPNFSTKQGALKFLQQGTQYDDVLFSNKFSDIVQKLSEKELITPKQRNEYAAFKANRAVELTQDPVKRKQFVDREFRPDLSPEQIEQFRTSKKDALSAEASLDKSNTQKYLGALGYTPEDVYRFGPDTSGQLNENIPYVGGAELPIISKSFNDAEAANQFSQAGPIAHHLVQSMIGCVVMIQVVCFVSQRALLLVQVKLLEWRTANVSLVCQELSLVATLVLWVAVL
jgi:hypothetical protein